MKKNIQFEYAEKIRHYYIGEDCIQTVIPYKKAITIVDEEGVLLNRKHGSGLVINKYVDDERKKQFPYSNIPEYKSFNKHGILNYANVLISFNKPFIVIKDGLIIEKYAMKDNDDAILITKGIAPQKEERVFTLEQLKDFTYSKDSIKEKFSFDGGIWDVPLIPEENEIIKKVRDYFFKKFTIFNDCDDAQLVSDLGKFKCKNDGRSLNDSLCNFIKDNYPTDNILAVLNGVIILDDFIVTYKDEERITSVKAIESTMRAVGEYETIILDYPLQKYSLEQAKYILQRGNGIKTVEPKISSFINKGIDRKLVKEEKQKVLTLNKKK